MAPAPSLVGLFIAPLNRAGIEYMATGGLAAVVYGHPRLTLDVDLVIRLARHEVDTTSCGSFKRGDRTGTCGTSRE